VSIIEQAAKRLEQLRQSGVEVDAPPAADAAQGAADKATEAVPLRVMKELESQGPRADSRGESAPTGAPGVRAGEVRGGASRAVEIDLARLSASGYIAPTAPRSRLAEEFRVIKRPLINNILGKSAAPVRNANRIMVTSAEPGEGKTFVSLNLAMSLAMELDTEVLLVDADAQRPALLERLGLAQSTGLLDLLADPDLPLESVVFRTNVERLSILPAGRPQQRSTELLASDAMSHLVEKLATSDSRRIVLFDTPPLLAASESRVLAAHMGQVVMVIAADETPQGTVAEALSTIENCPVVFTLLNRVSRSERGRYYGSYGAYGAYEGAR
jgi:protein-tyrosine kinase